MAKRFGAALVDGMAAINETPRRSNTMGDSLRGAAKVDNIGEAARNANSSPGKTGGGQRWQEKVWAYYDEVGELHYTLSFIGACLSRCVLTVGIPDEKGIIGPVFDEDGTPLTNEDGSARPELARALEALELIRALKNDIGGQSELLRRMGLNLPGVGEFHLVGSRYEGDTRDSGSIPITELQWEVLSTDEFRRKGKNYERKSGPGSQGQEVRAEDVHVVRIWKSHPRWSGQADSSIRAVLDILEELVLLTREVRGETLSRLSNAGILLVPEEIEWGNSDTDEDDEDADPFTQDLIETFSTAIADKASAAQTVPFVVRAPGEQLNPDRFRHIDLSPKNAGNSAEKRKEAVQRFAQGIDLPVEIVTGHADTTFANAVVIDDALFKAHIEPVLDLIVDALTVGFLRPALADPENQLVVHYDSGELVARPNRAQDAKDLWDRNAISDATLRASAGFSENDAPSDEELEARTARAQKTTPGQAIPGTPNGDPTNAEDGPGSNAPGSPVDQGDANLVGLQLSAATEATVERAIKRAGARLRGKANSYSGAIRDQLAQVPDAEVAITLGPTLVEKINKGDDLFHGEFDTLWNLAARWTADQNFADRLREACNEVANERLYQPRRPFPFRQFPAWGVPVVPLVSANA